MKGFELGQKIEDKCGMRASMTAELVFSDVKYVDVDLQWWKNAFLARADCLRSHATGCRRRTWLAR